MRISAIEEYGLRCILQLAKSPMGQPLPASTIAKREGISLQYASKILYLLRKGKIVKAFRGSHGGFLLSRPSRLISLLEVLRSLSVEQEDFCVQFSGNRDQCVHLGTCSLKPIWQVLFQYFDAVLNSLTLEDLARGTSIIGVDSSYGAIDNKKGKSC